MIEALVTAAVLLTVIAWMCFRMSRLHLKLAGLNQLVADMLRAGANPQQLRLAQAHREKTSKEDNDG